MDNPYASGGVGAGAVVALGLAYRVYLAINHHRVRSNCCGKELVVSVDVEKTTPPPDIHIRVPPEPVKNESKD